MNDYLVLRKKKSDVIFICIIFCAGIVYNAVFIGEGRKIIVFINLSFFFVGEIGNLIFSAVMKAASPAEDIPNENYIVRLLLVAAGIIFIGFGISLGVIADVVLNSGEGFVKALADVTKKDFGTVKIIFDVSWVLFSIVLSLLLFDGKLLGTREGTIISAVFVGVTVKIFRPILQKPLTKILMR